MEAEVFVQFLLLCYFIISPRQLFMMRKAINYFFMALGLVYAVSGLFLIFNSGGEATYELFFGLELSKWGYIAYKMVVGIILTLVAIIDLRRNK